MNATIPTTTLATELRAARLLIENEVVTIEGLCEALELVVREITGTPPGLPSPGGDAIQSLSEVTLERVRLLRQRLCGDEPWPHEASKHGRDA